VCSPAAVELARDGARQSVVLAKNVARTLPLDAAKYSRVVVIGRALNAQRCARPLRQQLRP
jgi:beta-glucosidase-like glycosyl hydrolase